MLSDEKVREIIASLVAEEAAIDLSLFELAAKKERIQAALAPLKTLLEPVEPEFDGGLADACRTVLKQSGKPLTPLEIRDAIKAIGYDLSKHKNEMASIHSVLKRMAESKDAKDVKKHELKEGTRYSWIGGPDVPPVKSTSTPTNVRLADAISRNYLDLQDSLRKSQAFYDSMYKSPLAAITRDLDKTLSLGSQMEEILKSAERFSTRLEIVEKKLPKL